MEGEPESLGRDVTKGSRVTLLGVMLACGVLYPLVYAIASDVIAASRYEGYSPMSQTISELGNPPRGWG